MAAEMKAVEAKLRVLLDAREPTAGLYIRVRGDHLVLGRRDTIGPEGQKADSDRVRLTRLAVDTYGLSVKRHTGRWENTPFCGSLEEIVDTLAGCMQHLVAPD